MTDVVSSHGQALQVILPPINSKGSGKVFVEFRDSEAAEKARAALHGRTFMQASVIAQFFPMSLFREHIDKGAPVLEQPPPVPATAMPSVVVEDIDE